MIRSFPISLSKFAVCRRGFSDFPKSAFISRDVVEDRVNYVISTYFKCIPPTTPLSSQLVADLEFDNKQRKYLIELLHEEFHVPGIDKPVIDNALTFEDFITYFSSHPKAR